LADPDHAQFAAAALGPILGGSAPYYDLRYRQLLARDGGAHALLLRATGLPACDWTRPPTSSPERDIRLALVLARRNVFFALHHLQNGRRAEGLRTLAAGPRLARHVAPAGPLFAALAAKTVLQDHLRAFAFADHYQPLTAPEKRLLAEELARLPQDGVDWAAALSREFEMSGADPALRRRYLGAFDNPAILPQLRQALEGSPRIPDPGRVLENRDELRRDLDRARVLLTP
jgi:hypothetical protein